jgi:hypothetical protein
MRNSPDDTRPARAAWPATLGALGDEDRAAGIPAGPKRSYRRVVGQQKPRQQLNAGGGIYFGAFTFRATTGPVVVVRCIGSVPARSRRDLCASWPPALQVRPWWGEHALLPGAAAVAGLSSGWPRTGRAPNIIACRVLNTNPPCFTRRRWEFGRGPVRCKRMSRLANKV